MEDEDLFNGASHFSYRPGALDEERSRWERCSGA